MIFFIFETSYMALLSDEARRIGRLYFGGIVLMFVGTIITWLYHTENYVGQLCIISGALLLCATVYLWHQADRQYSNGITEVSK